MGVCEGLTWKGVCVSKNVSAGTWRKLGSTLKVGKSILTIWDLSTREVTTNKIKDFLTKI